MGNSGFVDKLASCQIDPGAWVASSAELIGDVRIHRGASVWYGSVLRSDIVDAEVEIGENSNIQDGSVAHIDFGMPCSIGKRVTVGHGTILHGTTVGDDCLIGMGAVLLSGSTIGSGSIVAAGAVVPEGAEIPAGVVAAGVPAKVRREVTDKDRARIEKSWRDYVELMALHRDGPPGK